MNHFHRWVPWSINNSSSITIGLCVISHESLEIRFWKVVLLHHVIEFFPHYLLSLCVLKLHVTNHNGHHFAIGWIVHMRNHDCPTNYILHMIQTFYKSPTSCIHVTRFPPFPTPFMDILKMNTFCLRTCPRKQHSWM
jgi:hypothetical protein